MKIEENLALVLLSITLVTASMQIIPVEDCPECEEITCEGTLKPIKYRHRTGCYCPICSSPCPVREPVCPVGQQCVEKESACPEDYDCGNETIFSTFCELFTSCPPPKVCQNKCPETGFLKDQNGCATCLCNDPCKELKCPVQCIETSIQPGSERTYTCPK